MLRWLVLVVFTLRFLAVCGQSKVDSLERVLKQSNDFDSQYAALATLAGEFILTDPNRGIAYGKRALELSDGKEVDVNYAVYLHKSMGLNYYYLGQPEQALFYYLEGLRFGEKSGASKGSVSGILGNVGLLYYNQKDYHEAKSYFERSIKMLEGSGASQTLINGINNLGNTYYMLKDMDKAFELYNEGLKYAKELGDKRSLCISYNSVAFMAMAKEDYDGALQNYEPALKIARELKDNNMILYIGMNVADINATKGGYQKALEGYQEVLKVALETGNTEVAKRAYEQISGYYRHLGNYEQAYWNFAKFVHFNDSITSLHKDELMSEMKEKYETEKKEAEISKLKVANELKALEALQADQDLALAQKEINLEKALREKEKIESAQRKKQLEMERMDKKLIQASLAQKEVEAEQQRTVRNAIMIGGVLFLLLAIVAFISFINKRKDNKLIAHQKQMVEQQRNEAEYQKELLAEKNKEIVDSITYAQRIQEAILPPMKLVASALPQSFVYYQPKDIVAGDFYWLEHINETVYFAAADCTGHGVPGAMVSVVCSTALSKSLVEEGITEPARILDRTRAQVIDRFGRSESEIKDGMDVSLCAIQFNAKTMQWAGANNPLWIVRNGADEVEEIKADKQPVGAFAEEKPFTNHQVSLDTGDAIYIFSDGFADQFGGDRGKKFKSGAFKKLLVSIQHNSMQEQCEVLKSSFENWRGQLEQVDDVCVIGVRI